MDLKDAVIIALTLVLLLTNWSAIKAKVCGSADGFFPYNAFDGGKYPPGSGPIFWLGYSRLFGDKTGWLLHDNNNWPLPYAQAVAAVKPGDVVTLAGQPMGVVVGFGQHPSQPIGGFVILDRVPLMKLEGELVAIVRPVNATPS